MGIARADLLPGEGVVAGPIDNLEHLMILIDHDHRHEALARVGQRDRHWSGIEFEHTHSIKRVAVAALNGMIVNCRKFAEVQELAEAALFLELGRGFVRLGADENCRR